MFGQRKTCKEPNRNTGDMSFYFCTKKERQTVKIILETAITVWGGKGKTEELVCLHKNKELQDKYSCRFL